VRKTSLIDLGNSRRPHEHYAPAASACGRNGAAPLENDRSGAGFGEDNAVEAVRRNMAGMALPPLNVPQDERADVQDVLPVICSLPDRRGWRQGRAGAGTVHGPT